MHRILFVLTLLVALPSAVVGAEPTPIPREGRRLLVVVDLAKHAAADWRWMYELFDSGTVLAAHRLLGDRYRDIHVLAREHATPGNFRRALHRLAGEGAEAVDVIVQLHGNPGIVLFDEGVVETARLAADLAADAGLRGKLRALYSGACYGATHTADWLRGGFRVVNGARQVNTNGLWDLPAFLGAWRDGRSFQAAQDRGNHAGWIRFFDRWAERLGLGLGQADSFKIVAGASAITLGGEASRSVAPAAAAVPFEPGASLAHLPPADADGIVRLTAETAARLRVDAEATRAWARLRALFPPR